MRDLVERGHIYIAQPPLYKIRKGKQEQYLKDDGELANYQTQIALEGASLHVNSGAPGITDDSLESLVNQYHETYSMISRLSRIYPTEVLEAMIYSDPFTETDLKDSSQLEDWLRGVSHQLAERHPEVSATMSFGSMKTVRRQFLPEAVLNLHGWSALCLPGRLFQFRRIQIAYRSWSDFEGVIGRGRLH